MSPETRLLVEAEIERLTRRVDDLHREANSHANRIADLTIAMSQVRELIRTHKRDLDAANEMPS